MDLTISETLLRIRRHVIKLDPCVLSEINLSSEVKLDAMLLNIHSARQYFQDTVKCLSPSYLIGSNAYNVPKQFKPDGMQW